MLLLFQKKIIVSLYWSTTLMTDQDHIRIRANQPFSPKFRCPVWKWLPVVKPQNLGYWSVQYLLSCQLAHISRRLPAPLHILRNHSKYGFIFGHYPIRHCPTMTLLFQFLPRMATANDDVYG